MGYCYDQSGRLVCDSCGEVGGVRKVPCPFGWCPAPALCSECRAREREYATREHHRRMGCEVAAAESRQRRAEADHLLASGAWLRCSALNHDGRIKVVFLNGDGKERAYWMARRTYRAIPLLTNATPEDFKKHGKVTRAKSAAIYDPN